MKYKSLIPSSISIIKIIEISIHELSNNYRKEQSTVMAKKREQLS